MSDGKIPVGECLQSAVRFALGSWREALGPALAPAAGSGLFVALGGVNEVGAVTPTLPGFLALLAGYILFQAAVLRRALQREPTIRLRLGGDEARLGLATVGFMAIAIIVVIAIATTVALVSLVVTGAAADPALFQGDVQITEDDLSPAAAAVLGLGILFLFWTLFYVALRLVLIAPATIASEQVVVWRAWPLTRGNAWGIFACMLAVMVPSVFVFAILDTAILGPLGQVTNPAVSRFILAYIESVTVGLVWGGLLAVLWRGLGPVGAPTTTPGSSAT